MRLFILCIVSIFVSHLTVAQTTLNSILSNSSPDSAKVKSLLTLANNFEGRNADSQKMVVDTALFFAQRSNYKEGLVRVNNFYSSIYEEEGRYDDALKYGLKALKMAERSGLKKRIAGSANNVAVVYWDLKSYDTALNYYNRALKEYREIHDSTGIMKELNNLGSLYLNQNNNDKAMDYFQQGVAMALQKNDSTLLKLFYTNIGTGYTKKQNYDLGLSYGLKALEIAERENDFTTVASISTNIGVIYLQKKNYDEALKFFRKAQITAITQKNENLLITVLLNLYSIYSHEQRYDSAVVCLYQYDSLRQRAYNTESSKQIADMQTKYNTEKKEQQIKLLGAEKKNQQVVIRFISVLAILILAIAFFVYRNNRIKHRLNIELAEKNSKIGKAYKVIEEKNRDILDSITYAKRLQDAILPPLSMIKQHLPESFVLYKPKDIVAGDFYWMQKSGDNILIAACDCTGHGVPGALVSVVCSNVLNRAVKEFHLSEPGKILDKTRELVLETFATGGGDVKDGMDISLCSINMRTKEIHWSGAFNPLLYTNGGELHEITADKQPIGVTEKPVLFRTHSLALAANKGICLYLFTDGFADQFGGPKGKKYKFAQLRDKLLAISSKPMNEQKNFLEKEFDSWKGSLEQTDDVCVIGVRIG